MPRREGSALHGFGVVMLKELSDHLTSVRMRVLEWLVVLFALAALYGAIQQVKEVTAEDPFLFLRLFTTARESIPVTFVSFLSILVPLMAIGLGFDAVNLGIELRHIDGEGGKEPGQTRSLITLADRGLNSLLRLRTDIPASLSSRHARAIALMPN